MGHICPTEGTLGHGSRAETAQSRCSASTDPRLLWQSIVMLIMMFIMIISFLYDMILQLVFI